MSEGRHSATEDYRIMASAGRRTDFAHVHDGQVESHNLTPMVALSEGHALWLGHAGLEGLRAYRFKPIPDAFHGTHRMEPNPEGCSSAAVADRSIVLTFAQGKMEEFLVRTVTNQDATTVRVATNLAMFILTRDGDRLHLEMEPSVVNGRIQLTGRFEGEAKAMGPERMLPSQVVPDGRYAVACLRDVSGLRGQFDVRGNAWTRMGSSAQPSHLTFQSVKAIGDNWQLVRATFAGGHSPRELIVERFPEGYVIQGTQAGENDYDVVIAYPTTQPPSWSPIVEVDEFFKLAFARLAQQDTVTKTQLVDIFVKLALEKHLSTFWLSFLSVAVESSRPCQKLEDMAGNFGATLPQGPGMDKLQALCRTIPPSNDDE